MGVITIESPKDVWVLNNNGSWNYGTKYNLRHLKKQDVVEVFYGGELIAIVANFNEGGMIVKYHLKGKLEALLRSII